MTGDPAARVRAMGGSERLRLLERLCSASPDLVAAALDEMAAAAEARRVRRNRKSTLRHREQRRQSRQAARS